MAKRKKSAAWEAIPERGAAGGGRGRREYVAALDRAASRGGTLRERFPKVFDAVLAQHRKDIRRVLRQMERRTALTFLRRAVRSMNRDRDAMRYYGDSDGRAGHLRRALWRVVLTASRRSGTFDGKRKGGA